MDHQLWNEYPTNSNKKKSKQQQQKEIRSTNQHVWNGSK